MKSKPTYIGGLFCDKNFVTNLSDQFHGIAQNTWAQVNVPLCGAHILMPCEGHHHTNTDALLGQVRNEATAPTVATAPVKAGLLVDAVHDLRERVGCKSCTALCSEQGLLCIAHPYRLYVRGEFSLHTLI